MTAVDSTRGPPGDPSKETTRQEVALAFRNAIKLGGSLLATWTVAFVVKFQVPRHIGPERFGAFNFSENFAGAFFTLLDLGVDTYIVREVSIRPKHASDFFGGILALRALISVFLFAAMAFTLGVTHRSAEIQQAAVVFGVTQIIVNVNTTVGTLLQATARVGRLAIANVLAKVLWGVGILIGLHYHVSLALLAVPILVAELSRLAFLLPVAQRLLHLEYRIDLRAVKTVILSSLPFFMSSAALGLGGKINVAMLEYLSDPKELGWFSATQNLSSLAMLLSPLLSWVFTPMMARAKGRSVDEVITILRRAIEGLVVLTLPLTVILYVGADLWIFLAFGRGFAPAAMSMRVLSLVFVLTYLAMVLSSALVVLDKGWALTRISAVSGPLTPLFVLILLPICRRLFGQGGEATGAAAAVILCETYVVIASLRAVGGTLIDGRSVVVIAKNVGAAVVTLLVDHFLGGLGPVRIAVAVVVYGAIVLAIGGVRISEAIEAAKVILPERFTRRRGAPPPPAATDVQA